MAPNVGPNKEKKEKVVEQDLSVSFATAQSSPLCSSSSSVTDLSDIKDVKQMQQSISNFNSLNQKLILSTLGTNILQCPTSPLRNVVPTCALAKVGSCKAQAPEVYNIDSDGCYKMP